MAGWQFGNQEEPSKPTKGERIEALEQAVKIQSRAIGEVERNLGRYDIAAMASAGKTLEQANANNSNTLARHSDQIGAIIRRLGVVEAEQRDIVACQDSQGDRLRALEGREAWCNLMHEGQSQSVNPAYANALSDLHKRLAILEERADKSVTNNSNRAIVNQDQHKGFSNDIADLAERIASLENRARLHGSRSGVLRADIDSLDEAWRENAARLHALENRIGMGEPSDKPAEPEPFDATGIPFWNIATGEGIKRFTEIVDRDGRATRVNLHIDPAGGEDATVHGFVFYGTSEEVAALSSYADLITK